VIEQDLRVSGTSQGIISRSFLAKLRVSYPDSIIDVVYIKTTKSDDQLELLPVNHIETHVLNLNTTFLTKWINKIYWRVYHLTLIELNTHSKFRSVISKIDYKKYDHVFIRSSGLDHESILASDELPILKKAIINFHEPYPVFWCAGIIKKIENLDLFRMKKMNKVVEQAKTCMGTHLLANDMQFLYGSRKKFYTMPHQYDESVFDLSDIKDVFNKNKKVTLTYHGALQFGRNIDIVLDCYKELVEENINYKNNTEFVLRLKSSEISRLQKKYNSIDNIRILEGVNFSNSVYEQRHLCDINVLLENGPLYCSVLLVKIHVLASINKHIFSLSPENSEMRLIIKDKKYIANYDNKPEIKEKLNNLILGRLNEEEYQNPFGDYFSNENFKILIDKIVSNT
jgi:hypothetical protein